MHCCMAGIAQRDQVLFRIFARVAAEIFMVDLKVGHRAARLASPAVAAEDLVAQSVVSVGLEPQVMHVSVEPDS